MHERIHFIDHQGKRVLLFDCSNCPAHEVERFARAVPDYLLGQPRNSVLVLTDFAGAAFDDDAIRALKETAVFDKPFVKKSALVGTQSFPRTLYDDITRYSRREMRVFNTRDEALTWLVGDLGAWADPRRTQTLRTIAEQFERGTFIMSHAYSFATPCPVCKEDLPGKEINQPALCMLEEVRGDSPLKVWCSVCGSSWMISAEKKEELRKQINDPQQANATATIR